MASPAGDAAPVGNAKGTPPPARAMWAFTGRMDWSRFLAPIRVLEGVAGREARPPRSLASPWVNGYRRGIGSAREVSRRCGCDPGFQWLTGPQEVNQHTRSLAGSPVGTPSGPWTKRASIRSARRRNAARSSLQGQDADRSGRSEPSSSAGCCGIPERLAEGEDGPASIPSPGPAEGPPGAVVGWPGLQYSAVASAAPAHATAGGRGLKRGKRPRRKAEGQHQRLRALRRPPSRRLERPTRPQQGPDPGKAILSRLLRRCPKCRSHPKKTRGRPSRSTPPDSIRLGYGRSPVTAITM